MERPLTQKRIDHWHRKGWTTDAEKGGPLRYRESLGGKDGIGGPNQANLEA